MLTYIRVAFPWTGHCLCCRATWTVGHGSGRCGFRDAETAAVDILLRIDIETDDDEVDIEAKLAPLFDMADGRTDIVNKG